MGVMAGALRFLWIGSLIQLLLSQVEAVPPVVFAPSQNWDGIDGPWSSFSVRLGNPEQVVRVLPSTSGYTTIAILPAGCNSTSDYNGCVTSRAGVFDPTGSKTWQDEGDFGAGMENNLGYSVVNGDFGLDKVGLGIVDNPNVTFADQVIGGIVVDEFYVGLFGLGTQPTNFTTFADPHPSFFTSLKDSNNTPSYTWSYTAGAQYQLTGVLGSLIFGGYDSSRFTPSNITIPMSPDVSRDLVVGLQSISASYAAGSKSLLPSGGIFTFVDSTLPYIWLPIDACQQFEKVFGLTWNETLEMYLVNDTLHQTLLKMNPSFTFTIGISEEGGQTVDLTLPYASFDLAAEPPLVENATRYFPLKRAANSTQYTLGRAFLQETYLIADYERGNFSLSQCVFESGSTSNVVTILSKADAAAVAASASSASSPGASPSSSSSSKSSTSTSSISGGAIGGIIVAAVLILAIIGFFLFAWKTKKCWPFKTKPVELESGTDGTAGTPAMASQEDYTVDPVAAAELAAAKAQAAEAMGSPLSEMQDVHPVAGYFAKGGTHEMAGHPAAHEMDHTDSTVHEMFDDSVYREMHSNTSPQTRGTPNARSVNSNQPFSWQETPTSSTFGHPLPTYSVEPSPRMGARRPSPNLSVSREPSPRMPSRQPSPRQPIPSYAGNGYDLDITPAGEVVDDHYEGRKEEDG